MQNLKFNPTVSRLDGKIIALKELSEIEGQAADLFDFGNFSDRLFRFVSSNFVRHNQLYLSKEDLSVIDNFVQQAMINVSNEALQIFTRAAVMGILLYDRDKQGKTGSFPIKSLPPTTEEYVKRYNPPIAVQRAMEQIEVRGASYLSNSVSSTVDSVRNTLIDSLAKGHNPAQINDNLKMKFIGDQTEVNRNWRRVSATEITRAYSDGYIAGMDDFQIVLGKSMPDACEYCEDEINNHLFIVLKRPLKDYSHLSPDSDEYKELSFLWDRCIWVGKDNIGRSNAKTFRADHRERNHHERLTPTIPAHPHCHCVYIVVTPEMVFIDQSGSMKIKEENPEAWQKWYDAEIKPLQAIIAKIKSNRSKYVA